MSSVFKCARNCGSDIDAFAQLRPGNRTLDGAHGSYQQSSEVTFKFFRCSHWNTTTRLRLLLHLIPMIAKPLEQPFGDREVLKNRPHTGRDTNKVLINNLANHLNAKKCNL